MVQEVGASIRVVDRDEAEPYRGGVLGVWEQAFGPVADVPEWSEALWTGTVPARTTALLGTSADPADPAVALYRRRGCRQIGLLDRRTQVMGLRHPGRVQPGRPQVREDRSNAS